MPSEDDPDLQHSPSPSTIRTTESDRDHDYANPFDALHADVPSLRSSDYDEEDDRPEAPPRQILEIPLPVPVDNPQISDESAPNDIGEVSRRQRSPARNPGPTPSTSARKRPFHVSQPSDDDNVCIICLEPWTTEGPHQICCLPCGHLFGYNCIKQWLGQSRRGRGCPNCKHVARIRDVRYLFGVPARLVATDTSELEGIQKKLRQERESHQCTKLKFKEARKMAEKAMREVNELRRRASNPVPTFGGVSGLPERLARRPTLLADCCTTGDTAAVAFDSRSGVLYGEMISNSSFMTPMSQRLSRIDIGRCAVAGRSRAIGGRRINAISVAKTPSSPSSGSIAVVDAGHKMTILSPDLQIAESIDCGSALLSATWLKNKPNCVVVGALNGSLLTYDVRNMIGGPLCSIQLASDGMRAVHSVQECTVGGEGMVLAGMASGLFGVSYNDGFFTTPLVSKVECSDLTGAAICGVSVSNGFIAVAMRKGRDSSLFSEIILREGLRWQEDGKLGMGAYADGPLRGHTQKLPFGQVGVLSGGDDAMPMVVAGDGFAKGGARLWNAEEKGGSLEWKGFEIEEGADIEGQTVRACAALRLPRRARLGKVPSGAEALFACVSHRSIRLFGCGSYR